MERIRATPSKSNWDSFVAGNAIGKWLETNRVMRISGTGWRAAAEVCRILPQSWRLERAAWELLTGGQRVRSSRAPGITGALSGGDFHHCGPATASMGRLNLKRQSREWRGMKARAGQDADSRVNTRPSRAIHVTCYLSCLYIVNSIWKRSVDTLKNPSGE